MPLRSLIVVALRVYALYWVVNGVSEVIGIAPTIWTLYANISAHPGFPAQGYYIAILLLAIYSFVVSIALWFFADTIARLVMKNDDGPVSFSALGKADLYHLAFLFLGLYFLLNGVSGLVQSGYNFFAYDFPVEPGHDLKGQFLVQFLGHLAASTAALACLLGMNKWTRLLLRHNERAEN